MSIKIEKKLASIEVIKKNFESLNYICNTQIATAVFLAYHLEKPILIEGPPGVGKTELAKTAAEMLSFYPAYASNVTKDLTNQKQFMNGSMENSYFTHKS